jgi:hypothetical protein
MWHQAQHITMLMKLDIKAKGIPEIRCSTNIISETTSKFHSTQLSKTLWHQRKTEVKNTAEYIYEYQQDQRSSHKTQKVVTENQYFSWLPNESP